MAFSRDLAEMDYHGLSWTIMDYHGLSWTIMDYHGLSWTIMDYNGLSWTIMDCHICNHHYFIFFTQFLHMELKKTFTSVEINISRIFHLYQLIKVDCFYAQ